MTQSNAKAQYCYACALNCFDPIGEKAFIFGNFLLIKVLHRHKTLLLLLPFRVGIAMKNTGFSL